MTQYQDFNCDTISLEYFTKWHDIDINISTNKYVNLNTSIKTLHTEH